jgi:putative AlgH/UPF0301 family transcriptional regulator
MEDDLRVEAGTLLAAWPDLMDPNFMHSVVLVCQHSEEGAYGLVTNRATQFKASDLLTDHPTLKESDFPVFHCQYSPAFVVQVFFRFNGCAV